MISIEDVLKYKRMEEAVFSSALEGDQEALKIATLKDVDVQAYRVRILELIEEAESDQ